MLKVQDKIIHGVLIKPLRQSMDEQGKKMNMLRCDDPYFEGFGEISFSIINPNIIKGWHIHTEMTLNYAVIEGNIKLVLFDEREFSSTKGMIQEIFLGPDNYNLVKIPPLIWTGIKAIGTKPAILANCSTITPRKEEFQNIDPFNNHIPYDWNLMHY